MREISWIVEDPLAFQEGLWSSELVSLLVNNSDVFRYWGLQRNKLLTISDSTLLSLAPANLSKPDYMHKLTLEVCHTWQNT